MNFRIVARKDSAELFLYGVIGAGFFGNGIGAKDVVDALNSVGNVKTLNVRINSPGGDVFDGFAIYNALSRFPGRVEVDIDSQAASIASIIAMAGHTIRIAENAMVMIHDPYSVALGSAEDMRKKADLMDQVRDTLVQTYVKRTGNGVKKISDWMREETWFKADDAKLNGFADQIEQPLKIAACANAPWFKHQPKVKSATVTPLTDARRASIAKIEKRFATL